MKERVSYESQVLYVGPTQTGVWFGNSGDLVTGESLTGLTPIQLQHVNRIEHTLDTNTETPYQFGTYNPMGKVITEPLLPSLEFEYSLADGYNEKWMGLQLTSGSFSPSSISGLLSGLKAEQNYYILTTQRGDAVTDENISTFLGRDDLQVMAFGNAVIENYYIEASIDSIPSATVQVNASNFTYASGASGFQTPAVNTSGCQETGKIILPPPRQSNLEVDALRPAYISLTFDTGNLPYGGAVLPSGGDPVDNLSSCSIDRFTLNLQLPRRINQTLGNRYPLSKPVQYPSQVLFSCSAKTKDIVSGNLMDIICSTGQRITVEMNNPYNGESNFEFVLENAYLDSNVSQHDLVQNESVNLNFVAPLGAPAPFNRIGDSSQVAGALKIGGAAVKPQSTTYGTTTGQLLEGTNTLLPPI